VHGSYDHLQPIVILRDCPEIEQLWAKMLAADDEAEKKIEELEKMAKRIQEVRAKANEDAWGEIIVVAKKKGLVPQDLVMEKTHSLGVVGGTLMVRDRGMDNDDQCPCPVCQIRALFNKRR
jgi:hypothetical protein